jgi:endonuclease YncB( thermonuclease family)
MGRILPLLITLLGFHAKGWAGADEQTYEDAIISEITSIYDGDTFRANIPGWPPIIGNRISIRVNGVDTPELRGHCDREKQLAREAKEYVVTALRSAKQVELKNIRRGKYFRILADVFADGESLAAGLLRRGLAVPYDGGTKKDWCKDSNEKAR